MTITQNHIAEFLALAVSIIYWNDIKTGKLRWLPIFLLFILLVELAGNYFKHTPYANAKLYNLSLPFEYLFYLFLFRLHGERFLKYFSIIGSCVLFLFAIIYIIIKPFSELHDNVLIVGQISVVICCCIYLFEKFNGINDDSLLNDYFFWMISGLLLFNLGDFTYFRLLDIIKENKWDRNNNNNKLLLMV